MEVDALPDAETAPPDGPAATGRTGDGDPPVSTGAGLSAGPDPAPNRDPEGAEPPAPATAAVSRTRRYLEADVSDDDRDIGWGDPPGGSERADGWYLRERPPHHG